jgi:hypothetical protein
MWDFKIRYDTHMYGSFWVFLTDVPKLFKEFLNELKKHLRTMITTLHPQIFTF